MTDSLFQLVGFPVLVEHADGLAFLPGQRAGLEDVALGAEAETLLELLLDHEAGDALFGLDVDPHVADAVDFLDDDLVVASRRRGSPSAPARPAWEEVDALDDEHVVDAAGDAVEPQAGAAAFALLPGENAGEVAGAEADDGDGLAVERREDDLALLAVRHRLAGHRDR